MYMYLEELECCFIFIYVHFIHESLHYHNVIIVNNCLSHDVVSESVIKPCIKNDNPLVD